MLLKLTRLELLLIAALALLWGAQLAWHPAPSALGAAAASSWKEQEKKTRAEIHRTMETDRTALETKLRGNPALWQRFQWAMFGLMLVVIGSLYCWGCFLLCRLLRAPSDLPLGRPPPASWGFRQIFRLVLGILLVIQCSILFQTILFRLFHPGWLDRRVGALADTLLVDLVAAAGASWLLFRGKAAGWNPAKIPLFVVAAVRSYLMAVPVLVLVLMAVAAVLNLLKIEPAPQPIFAMYLSEGRTAVVRVLLLLAVVAGPVAEEIFFRGLLYGWLRQRIGVRNGLLISSFLFALLHMDAVAFFPILGLGLLFGWAYERTGSLAAPVAIHILHNGGMLFVASVIKAVMVQS